MSKVLLVEDNDLNRDMLTRRLERRAHTVVSARDGAEGMRLAQTLLPDIILMDISLPEVDGWQATRYLKSQAETRDIPIIALTAHAMPADRRKAAEVGFDDFETKPIDLECLLAKMGCLLAERATSLRDPHPICQNQNRSGTAGTEDGL